MKTNAVDKDEKIVNEQEQLKPLNAQDEYDDTTATAEDKKKGYKEGNRNDSNTAEESAADAKPDSVDKETT